MENYGIPPSAPNLPKMAGSATCTVLFGVFAATFTLAFLRPKPADVETKLQEEIGVLREQYKSLKERIVGFDVQLKTLTSTSVPDTDIGRHVADIQWQQANIATRLDALEKGLLDDPQKALSLPLLRNDVVYLKTALTDDAIETAKSVDRVYDLLKWMIGLGATVVLGLLTLMLNLYLNRQKSNDNQTSKVTIRPLTNSRT